MPAMGHDGVDAISLKPGGSSVTLSPWLIQTFSFGSPPWSLRPLNSASGLITFTSAWPNSRWSAASVAPPSCAARGGMP
ncbi:hypothetical protein G6F31_021653 [Rhizopus arrhizus]|nr:hypothetical protein G6F31_021653 [Rhizopus arrhizus]